MKIDLNIYIPQWAMAEVKPDDLTSLDTLKDYLYFSRHPMDGITVGHVTVDVELMPKEEIVSGAVLALRAKQAEIRKEAEQKCQALERAEQQLLALPMVTK